MAYQPANVGTDAGLACDPTVVRESARESLDQSGVRAAHLHGLQQHRFDCSGLGVLGQTWVPNRLVGRARGHAARAPVPVLAPPARGFGSPKAMMLTIRRYFAREIYAATLFVFAAFLALFAFFDLIHELGDLGKGDYRLQHALLYVLLSVPSHVYELFPIAVLIGTLYALAHLAANSEYTVMRGSGLAPGQTALALGRIGLVFVIVTYLVG